MLSNKYNKKYNICFQNVSSNGNTKVPQSCTEVHVLSYTTLLGILQQCEASQPIGEAGGKHLTLRSQTDLSLGLMKTSTAR